MRSRAAPATSAAASPRASPNTNSVLPLPDTCTRRPRIRCTVAYGFDLTPARGVNVARSDCGSDFAFGEGVVFHLSAERKIDELEGLWKVRWTASEDTDSNDAQQATRPSGWSGPSTSIKLLRLVTPPGDRSGESRPIARDSRRASPELRWARYRSAGSPALDDCDRDGNGQRTHR